MLILETVHTPGIAQLSYLIGDDSKGEAAVVDPRPDCAVYLDIARQKGVAITRIFETHIHADFMSGARELSARLGGAPICASHAGGATYGFDTEQAKDGQEFEFGSILLRVRHTPGHTPEHISFLVAETKRGDHPFGILSGDTVFVDSVGRPDLLGQDETTDLARRLFDSIRSSYLGLDDGVILYPGHGAGSACGPDIGDRMSSTIGYEKRFNSYLTVDDPTTFAEKILKSAPPEPRHYRPLKKLNSKGPPVFGGIPSVPPLPAREFERAVKKGKRALLDTRGMLAFAGGHIKGAFNIGARPELSVWAGWMLDFEDPLLLVLDSDSQLETVVNMLWRTGYTRFSGYLVGGMQAWDNAGLPLDDLPLMTVHELKKNGKNAQIVDVRSPSEWQSGHIPGARHIFVPDLRRRAKDLDRNKPVITYCDSGFRASLASSILKQEGFGCVCNVPGSMQAWRNAGYPIEHKSES